MESRLAICLSELKTVQAKTVSGKTTSLEWMLSAPPAHWRKLDTVV